MQSTDSQHLKQHEIDVLFEYARNGGDLTCVNIQELESNELLRSQKYV